MHLDPATYLRLEKPQSLGATSSGASFATSTGDILEVSAYGPGVFRLRFGPRTKPDYGIVVGRAKPCTVSQSARDTWRFAVRRRCARDFRRRVAAHGAQLEGSNGAGVDHRRALPRLDAIAGVRPPASGRAVDRGARAAQRRERLRPRREVRPARQARPADPLAGRGCARRQHRPLVQEHTLRVESRQRQGRMGRVRAYARHGDARRRLPGLVASQLRDAGRGRSARPVPVCRRHAGGDHRQLHRRHRQGAGRAALEPRPVGFPRVLQDAGRGRRSRGRNCARIAFRQTC